MNRTAVRITIVGMIQLLMFETLCQWSVHWRESSEELVGLYEAPGWVAQHPGFQRSLRARIEANRWSPAKKADMRSIP
ncbi:MAG: hypothetical protein RBR19_08755 [Sedimentisphaerales bacterium]|jgi:hypothetical protein|nr:hypothetical protein [Sedimentisphaerales bacterium]NLT76079.1 hypothetical protein [Planctomycetota bacterium]